MAQAALRGVRQRLLHFRAISLTSQTPEAESRLSRDKTNAMLPEKAFSLAFPALITSAHDETTTLRGVSVAAFSGKLQMPPLAGKVDAAIWPQNAATVAIPLGRADDVPHACMAEQVGMHRRGASSKKRRAEAMAIATRATHPWVGEGQHRVCAPEEGPGTEQRPSGTQPRVRTPCHDDDSCVHPRP